MQTPSTLWIWLSQQAGPLAFIAALLLVIVAILSFSARRRRLGLTASRSEENEAMFVNYLTPYGFDATIARTTYLYLQERQDAAFPIGVGDLLDEDMGMSRTQVQEALKDLMRINGRSFHGAPAGAPLLTVEDLIRYLQASPREEALAA